jgi:hypothetical protein
MLNDCKDTFFQKKEQNSLAKFRGRVLLSSVFLAETQRRRVFFEAFVTIFCIFSSSLNSNDKLSY